MRFSTTLTMILHLTEIATLSESGIALAGGGKLAGRRCDALFVAGSGERLASHARAIRLDHQGGMDRHFRVEGQIRGDPALIDPGGIPRW